MYIAITNDTNPISKCTECGGQGDMPNIDAKEQCWEWLAKPQNSAFNTKNITIRFFNIIYCKI